LKSLLFVTVALLVLGGCASQPIAPVPASPLGPAALPAGSAAVNEAFDRLADDYFEEMLALNPSLATSIGDDRYNDRYEVSFSDDYRTRARALYEKYATALSGIDTSSLDAERALSAEILRRNLERSLQGLEFPSHLQPLNQFRNFASSFVQLGSGGGIHPFKTVKDYDDFLSRVDGFVQGVDVAIAQMRRGVQAGIVEPRVLMEKALPQIEAHVVTDPEQSLFHGPIRRMPETFSSEERERLTREYRAAIRDRIIPAYARLHAFVRDEYLPQTRQSVGLSALPGGRVWYEYLVGTTTTTDLTPDEIQEIGLAEVERIHREMESVMRTVGFEGDLQAFFAYVRDDARFRFSSRDQMLAEYRAAQGRIDASTDRLFDVKPKADYEIRPVEPFRERSAAGGSYMAASADGSRPGVFYLNTYNAHERSRNGMESLLLHEGSPGHHFQISIQRELESLPRFRRFGGVTAYSEGWGLYAESLGKELGLYTDPYQYYGALSAELWRAIRLVLDTGIHAKGWTREQALEYARQNSSQSETSRIAEVERFIAIPSQALAYKIGQLKITELRRRAEQALGADFDIKAFHRAVLEDGALPLDALEQKIDRWISSHG
jgi:uncharacterized protein (DUF885 family)